MLPLKRQKLWGRLFIENLGVQFVYIEELSVLRYELMLIRGLGNENMFATFSVAKVLMNGGYL